MFELFTKRLSLPGLCTALGRRGQGAEYKAGDLVAGFTWFMTRLIHQLSGLLVGVKGFVFPLIHKTNKDGDYFFLNNYYLLIGG